MKTPLFALPEPGGEYGVARSDEEIGGRERGTARLHDPPVRSYMMALAHRRAGEVLQADRDTARMP